MVTYGAKSLVDIANNDFSILSGTVTRSDGILTFEPNSSCRFEYSYDTDKNKLKTDSLLVKYNISNSEKNVSSRYNTNLKISIKIKYYKEAEGSGDGNITYISGPCSIAQIYPYYNDETDKYIDNASIEISTSLIQGLIIEIENTNQSDIAISELNIYYGLNFNESVAESRFILGTYIEPRTDDPEDAEVGRTWLRIDIDTPGGGGTAVDGTVWFSGYGEPDESLGSNLDYYLNSDNGDVYKKDTGHWLVCANIKGKDGKDGKDGADGANGKDGANGQDGKDGADGSKILNGTTDPSGTEGSDGDYYINTTSGDYFDKESGSWVKLGTLGSGSSSGVKNFNIDTSDTLTTLTNASRGDFANLYKETAIEVTLTQANMTDIGEVVSQALACGNQVVYDELTSRYIKKDRIKNASGSFEYYYSISTDGINFTMTSTKPLKTNFVFIGSPASGLVLEGDGKSVLDLSTLTLKGTLNAGSASYRTGLKTIMNGWIMAIGTSSSYPNEISKDNGATWTKLSWYGPVYYDNTTGTLYTYSSNALKKTTDLETFETLAESGKIGSLSYILKVKDNKLYYVYGNFVKVYDIDTYEIKTVNTLIGLDGSIYQYASTSYTLYIDAINSNDDIYMLYAISNSTYKKYNGVYKLNDDLTFTMILSTEDISYSNTQKLVKQGNIYTVQSGSSFVTDTKPYIYTGTGLDGSGLIIERALYCLIGPDPTNALNWVKIK